MKRGFSLVELSIVLVILGLLTGGILAGQSLIRAAELRSVSTEYSRYVTAGQTFRDKYFALPGDFRDATKFWQRYSSSGAVGCVTNSAAAVNASTGSCDGNGNGVIQAAAGPSQAGEMFHAWRQLALAGLIEGSYSGLSSTANGGDHVVGTNCPTSKLSNSGWGIWDLGTYAGDAATYAGDYGNLLGIGRQVASAWPLDNAFKPEEVWNIDTKMDDGKPGTGRIVPRDNAGFNSPNGCTTSTTNTDYAGEYRLNNTAVICSLHFKKAF